MNRQDLSNKYASGTGIEIGAFCSPFPTNPRINKIIYLDKRSHADLIEWRNKDPNVSNDAFIPPVDIIDTSASLESVESNQFDFLVSSHQLEHVYCPINSILNHIRIVKVNGYVIYAIPLNNNPIDKDRVPTSFDHMMNHFFDCDSVPIEDHFDEYLRVVDKMIDPSKRKERIKEMIRDNADIHFHCWNVEGIKDLFKWAETYFCQQFQIELMHVSGIEMFVVLRKTK